MANPSPPPTLPKATTKKQAIALVDVHVSPKECFVWLKNTKEGWEPIPGTGCAHYVAHTLGTKGTGSKCDAGYIFRVPDLISGLATVLKKDVAVNDIWTNAGLTHTGLVVEVVGEGDARDFVIEHCSSAQHGVVRNNWKQKFSGQGRFYRPALARGAQPTTATSTARNSGFPVNEAFS